MNVFELKDSLIPGKKYTFLFKYDMGYGVTRRVGTVVSVEIKPWAQYNDAIYIVFRQARKRYDDIIIFRDTNLPTVYEGDVSVDTNAFTPAVDKGDVSVSTGKYRSCSPEFMNDAVNSTAVKPINVGSGAVSWISRYMPR